MDSFCNRRNHLHFNSPPPFSRILSLSLSRIFSSSLSNFFFFPLESSLLDFPFLEFLLHPSDSVYLSRSPLLLPLLLLLLLLPDWNFHRSKRLRGPRRPFAGELTVPRTCVFQLLRAPSLGEGANEA